MTNLTDKTMDELDAIISRADFARNDLMLMVGENADLMRRIQDGDAAWAEIHRRGQVKP